MAGSLPRLVVLFGANVGKDQPRPTTVQVQVVRSGQGAEFSIGCERQILAIERSSSVQITKKIGTYSGRDERCVRAENSALARIADN